jgi:hypothetical protein
MICHWCGDPVRVDVPNDHPLSATREHLIPKVLKPKGAQRQLVLAHLRCNNMRQVMEATAFKRLMNGEAMTKFQLWPHLFGERPCA